MKSQIRKLDSLTHNDSAATKLINDNFKALQQGIEDSLSRTGKTPNFMDKELDMNTRRIINVGDPLLDADAINKRYADEHYGNSDELEAKLDQEIEDRIAGDEALRSDLDDLTEHVSNMLVFRNWSNNG